MYLVRITDNSLQTVTLSGQQSPILGVTYFPAPGDEETVTETAVIVCEGAASAIQNVVNDIERLLNDAANRTDLLTPKVYVEASATAASSTLRSEVLGGRVEWSQTPGRHKLDATTNQVELAVIWTRRNFWEASIENEVFLSSGTMSERTGGVDVYNNDNASSSTNWVGIASNRIAGVLPTPLRLRILNTAGSALAPRNYYIALNANSSPTSMDCWLLGSESTSGSSQSWGTGGITHGSLLFTFPLSNTLLSQAQGRAFRVLAAFSSVSGGPTLRAGVYSSIGGVYVPLVLGREINNSANYELVDLGAFPIPPGGYNVSTTAAALVITARAAFAGGLTMDFTQLMATDAYRRLEQIGYNTSNNEGVEDDGISGGTYYWDGSNKYPIVKGYYEPILVYPGKAQRLYILFDEGTDFVAGRKMQVRAFYRPRVRTI